MRIRAELVAGGVLAALIGLGAAALGARRARPQDQDLRRSTFLSGPAGALGYAQALERLGVRVDRLRRMPEPAELTAAHDSVRTLVAVLGPTEPLSADEARALVHGSADLLVSGLGADMVFRCLGYRWQSIARDTGRVRAVLAARPTRSVTDSSGVTDGVVKTCAGPAPLAVDTLLRAADSAAALRLTYAGGRTVTLVADDRLFTNRRLRQTDAGPFAIGLAVPRYRRVMFDEYHHGFGTSTSLAGALVAWSARSPWGWAAWQLGGVGILALLAAAIRFGPARTVIDRRRRSPLEHVHALATALAASRGHGVAVELLVRGLRRRLSRTGQASHDDMRTWLQGLRDSVQTAEGRRALDTLQELTSLPAGTDDVRRAANAVEDVWEELTPKSRASRSPMMPSPRTPTSPPRS